MNARRFFAVVMGVLLMALPAIGQEEEYSATGGPFEGKSFNYFDPDESAEGAGE